MKRKRSIGKVILSFCLAITLVLQTVAFSVTTYADNAPSDAGTADGPPSVTEAVYDEPASFQTLAAGPTDKTAVFMNANSTFPLEVKQGDKVVAPETGTIQGRQQFTLKSEGLKLPVNGDAPDPTNADPNQYIQKGDWIELKREDYFKEVVLPKTDKPLVAETELGQKPLGTAYFTPNSIKIVFNGDDYFFNGIGTKITFGFETTADADVTGMGYNQTKPIAIFGGNYQLLNPNITPAYAINMRSMSNNQPDYWRYSRGNIEIKLADFLEGVIQWKAEVSASDRDDVTIPVPLDGTKFSNDLTNIGELVENSFQVFDSGGNPVSATPIYSGGKLTYTFPSGFGDKATITYKTWIPKKTYYYEYRDTEWGNRQIIYNFSQLFDSTDQELVNSKKAYPEDNGWGVGIKPDWIQASASYDHPNETITWKVTVNPYNKKGLKDFTITNALPAGLEFTSATWQSWKNGTASTIQNITPDANGGYSFGDIDGKVELVIKSKVKNGSSFKIEPRANWNLDTPGGIQNNDVTSGRYPVAVTDEATVTIGAHTFTKTGSVSMEDYNLGGVTWTVNLTPQYPLPDAAVYDVLVHGGDLNVLDNAVDATGEVDAKTIAKIKDNVTSAQLWKKYQNGTLKGGTNASGLTLKAIPLTVNGEVVADLIKVKGYTTNQLTSFSFRTLETDPNFLFKQDINVGKGKTNRALLFDGETVKQAQFTTNLHIRMLNKDMLYASKPLKADGTPESVTPNNVGSYIRNDSNEAWTISGFDRATKTVTFRLGVNMPGYNTEEMAKYGGSRVISNIKLVDTLPEGWEFVPFSEGKDFELWKGYSENGSNRENGVRNDALSPIEPGTSAHVVSFSHNGNVGTFTFSKLESPYVILVKARPSNAALEKYLDEYITNGTDRQVLYNKADLHMTWGGVEKTVTEQRKIIVPIQTLGKTVSKPTPGVLEWTVNYTPPFNMEQGVFLQDTIGANMNLRYDVDGKLVLTAPSMAVYRAKLTASGALEREGAALDLSDPNAEVQVEAQPGADGKTILTFKMDDPNQFYQFVYQTEVDSTKAKMGDKMGNEVKLVGDDKLKSVSAKSETTLNSSDVAGASASNAQLSLKKVDPNNNPLEGVEFTLFKKDDDAVVTKGRTKADGKLDLLFPDPGYYELKETYIDTNTWLPTTRIYQVYVGSTPGKPIWVDGIKVDTNNPLVVPTPAQGKLTISNTVVGKGGDKAKEFVYTVSFDGEGEGGTYAIINPSGTKGTIKSGDSIIIKDGQKAVLPALPAGLAYTVTQTDYTTVDGYTTDPETRERFGAIENKVDHNADFVNKRDVNNLTVSNTVTGDGAEPDKPFKYTVTFDGTGKGQTYNYEHSDGTTGKVASGASFELKHGETITIKDLPDNLKYTITQDGYKNDGYATIPVTLSDEGVMAGADREADFANERTVNKLTISNTVMGNGGDKTKAFEYTVTFEDVGKDGRYAYTKSDGVTSTPGTITSGESFTLKDGESLEIVGLPTGLKYTVTQKDYNADGYVTNPEKRNYSEVMEGNDENAPFTNVRVIKGGLLISNEVKGKDDDKKKPFKYTVTFTGKGANGSYSYEKPDGTKGTIASGGTFELKDGETLVVQGLPTYLEYTVTQDDYSAEGYVTDPKSFERTGTIPEKKLAEARFFNIRPYLEGVLRDNNTGKEIPDAEIIVTNKKTNKQQKILTNEKGKYFVPAEADTDYTITYTQMYQVGGKDVPVEFTQKAKVGESVTGGTVQAKITAVGIVLFKQLDGTKAFFNDSVINDMYIYLKDEHGNYIGGNDNPKAYPMGPSGTFSVEELSEQKYTMEVRYKAETGEELLFKVAQLDVKANGELNISEELVDPYGTVYDASTGDVERGKKLRERKLRCIMRIRNGI